MKNTMTAKIALVLISVAVLAGPGFGKATQSVSRASRPRSEGGTPATQNAQEPARAYQQLKYPKLADLQVPAVQRLTLPNGMQLFVLEDPELPLVHVSALIRTGSIYEPADKIGLADLTGTVMRTGGTTTKTGDQIDEQLEQIAASVETYIGDSSGGASMSVLKEDVDTGLAILAEVLMHPAFRQDKIDLAKISARSAIARRNDVPGRIAMREYAKLIYGADSVYARQAEYATIDSITRDDLVAFHRRYFHPNHTMLAVWGDFQASQIIAKIKEAFKDWPKAEVELPPVPKVTYEFRPTVNAVRKDDMNQGIIRLGHLGCLMNDPDYHALMVMNQILGGGFTSRLFKNVRSRQGLAYSVGGAYGADYDHPGLFALSCQTKLKSTVHATEAILAEVKKMTQEQVTDEELALAKDSYLNSFVFNFASKGQIINRLMTYAYYGYPADFLQKTKENVEKVTKADVLRVGKAHLRPDKMQILVVGRPDELDKPLSTLGEVKTIDVTIPAPKP
ncbi:MAG: insulinase family protein [Planctomycetes bacterium]|nr:insulinase family protein [Planctomycetota bacterium]